MPAVAFEGRLSVVVPVKNEADNVEPLIREIHAVLQGLHAFEIVYVDDGSTDETPRILRHLCAEFAMLRVLRHRTSCGQSTAIRTGVKAAQHPWIVTLDGDGQNDPADIPALLAALEQPGRPSNLWMVAGWRKKRNDTWLRRLSSRIANGVRGRLLKDHTPDTGCGLKVFSREVFLDLPYFDHMHRFLPALVMRAGGAVMSVAVNHRPRTRGTSKYGLNNRLWVGIVDILGVMWLQRRAKVPVIERE